MHWMNNALRTIVKTQDTGKGGLLTTCSLLNCTLQHHVVMKSFRVINHLPFLHFAFIFSVLVTGCKYDIGEELYGTNVPCEGGECISYLADIEPLMVSYCQGCHSGNNPSSNLDLTTHASVSQAAIEGDLSRVLRLPTSNPLFMPYGGDPLAEEDIQLIELWTTQGAPNN